MTSPGSTFAIGVRRPDTVQSVRDAQILHGDREISEPTGS